MSDSMREMPSEKTPRQHPVSDEQVKGIPEDLKAQYEAARDLTQSAIVGGLAETIVILIERIARSEQALAALEEQKADDELAFNHANEVVGKLEADVAALEARITELTKALEESRRVLVIDNEYAADSNSVLAIDAALRGLAGA